MRRAFWDPDSNRTLAEVTLLDGDRHVAVLVLTDGEGQILWRTVAAAQPDLARRRLRTLQAHGDVLYVVYDLNHLSDVPQRIAAFNLATGRRLWDVGRSRRWRVGNILADSGRVYVVGARLDIFDARDGRRLGHLGG